MIVAICGYGTSGASAVLDFLRGFEELQVVPFEFQILHQADGLSDLKYHLTQSRERVACNAAIHRFRKLMYKSISGHRIRKIVGKDYTKIVEGYLYKIVLSEWKGRSNYDPVDLSDRSTNEFFCFLQQGITHMLRKVNKSWCFPGYRTRYFSIVDEDVFDKATSEFLMEIFSAAGYDLRNDLVLDMLLSATNPAQGMEYFDKAKAIIVVRDPRDTYIRSQVNVYLNSFMPQNSVKGFCTFYETVMKKSVLDERTMIVQYEDLIYKYVDTKKKIMDFLGYDHDPANEYKYFNPNISVKYTNLAPKYPQYNEAIQYIEQHLGEYIYDFGEYVPLNIESVYEGDF